MFIRCSVLTVKQSQIKPEKKTLYLITLWFKFVCLDFQ